MAKRFFYVCAGLLMLAMSYHFGARTAVAQGAGNPVAAVVVGRSDQNYFSVTTENGDIWMWDPVSQTGRYVGNIFGAPTSATTTSWGKVKADYRK